MSAMRMHPSRPIADGIPFDDLDGFDDAQRNFLASRGVVFCTEFKANGRRYAGNIVAVSMAGAEEIAFGRGLDEKVVGLLVETGSL
jgi:hypothetical protein